MIRAALVILGGSLLVAGCAPAAAGEPAGNTVKILGVKNNGTKDPHRSGYLDFLGGLTWSAGSWQIATGGVTSVGLTVPSIMSVSGSPVTSSGTLAVSMASQSANQCLCSPDGSSGAPTARALTALDLPYIDDTTVANTVMVAAGASQALRLQSPGATITLSAASGISLTGTVIPSAGSTYSIGTGTGNALGQLWSTANYGLTQTVTFSATPTFNCGSSGEIKRIVLTNNVSSWSMSAGSAHQRCVIEWIQDGTGSRTLGTAGANIRLAGGALTLSTGANKRDIVTFDWDPTDSLWIESSRAQNL